MAALRMRYLDDLAPPTRLLGALPPSPCGSDPKAASGAAAARELCPFAFMHGMPAPGMSASSMGVLSMGCMAAWAPATVAPSAAPPPQPPPQPPPADATMPCPASLADADSSPPSTAFDEPDRSPLKPGAAKPGTPEASHMSKTRISVSSCATAPSPNEPLRSSSEKTSCSTSESACSGPEGVGAAPMSAMGYNLCGRSGR
eukprot:361616-Chlamydomonas_euryale.AAC.6